MNIDLNCSLSKISLLTYNGCTLIIIAGCAEGIGDLKERDCSMSTCSMYTNTFAMYRKQREQKFETDLPFPEQGPVKTRACMPSIM